MNDLTRLLLVAHGDVATSAELAACGVDGHGVRHLVRRGELVRVRSGALVDGERYRQGSAAERHVLAVRAIARRLPGYAGTHRSAAALWDLPVVAAQLGLVHLAQVGSGRARTSGRLVVHPPVHVEDVVEHAGVPVVTPTLAVLQTAGQSMSAGLMAADAAVRMGLTSRDRLVDEASRRRCGYPAHRVAELASEHSESPGESWTRLVLAGLGFGAEQQVSILDGDGRFVACVDFLLRQGAGRRGVRRRGEVRRRRRTRCARSREASGGRPASARQPRGSTDVGGPVSTRADPGDDRAGRRMTRSNATARLVGRSPP